MLARARLTGWGAPYVRTNASFTRPAEARPYRQRLEVRAALNGIRLTS